MVKTGTKTETETLMELVSMGGKISEPYPEGQKLIRRATRLKKLGFLKVGDQLRAEVSIKVKLSKISEIGYICITPEKISAYLDRKAERYNKEHKPKEESKSPPGDCPPENDPFRVHIDDHIRELLDGGFNGPECFPDPREPATRAQMREMSRPGLIPDEPDSFDKERRDYVRAVREISEIQNLNIRENRSRELEENRKARFARISRQETLNAPEAEMQRWIARQQQQAEMATGVTPSMLGTCPDYAPKSMPTESEIFEKQTCDYSKTDPNTIGKFVYTETPLHTYETIPPAEVLKTLEEHSQKKCFDYFAIAKVNSVVDPILFGRVFGTNKRFFICQWGKDICLDDII